LNKKKQEQISLQALKKFRIIYGAVRQHFTDIEQTCGITGSQLWILQEVGKAPGIGVSELAGILSVHQSTCSQLVDKLVARELITKERSKEDQRRVGLTLTTESKAILKSAPGPAEGVLPEALSSLPTEALEELDILLEMLVGQLKTKNAKLAGQPLSEI